MVPLQQGTRIGDGFQLVRPLDDASLSRWLARDVRRDVPVEVHFARRLGEVRRERAARRFAMLAALDHRNLLAVYGHGRLHDGTPYLVTGAATGETLERRLDRLGWLSFEECATLLGPVCDALGEANRHGLSHGAISPRMLLLRDQPHGLDVTLLGFHVAALDTQQSPGAGGPQNPPYREPNAPLDDVADRWALAVTAHEALVGDVPVALDVEVSRARKGVPQSLDLWFGRALREERDHRFSSARELGDSYAEAWRALS